MHLRTNVFRSHKYNENSKKQIGKYPNYKGKNAQVNSQQKDKIILNLKKKCF